jgi:hypothetical protein
MDNDREKYQKCTFSKLCSNLQDNVEEQKQLLRASLENIFKHHAGIEHLVIDQLFFINALETYWVEQL